MFQKQPLEVFYKKNDPKTFAKFTKKHLSWSFFFDKTAGLRTAIFKATTQLFSSEF